jgi:hypothetical protein
MSLDLPVHTTQHRDRSQLRRAAPGAASSTSSMMFVTLPAKPVLPAEG